jgi:hypothetical protein
MSESSRCDNAFAPAVALAIFQMRTLLGGETCEFLRRWTPAFPVSGNRKNQQASGKRITARLCGKNATFGKKAPQEISRVGFD